MSIDKRSDDGIAIIRVFDELVRGANDFTAEDLDSIARKRLELVNMVLNQAFSDADDIRLPREPE